MEKWNRLDTNPRFNGHVFTVILPGDFRVIYLAGIEMNHMLHFGPIDQNVTILIWHHLKESELHKWSNVFQ